MGTIELVVDQDDDSEDESKKKVAFSKTKIERKIAKVMPFEQVLDDEDEDQTLTTEVILDEDSIPGSPMLAVNESDDPLGDQELANVQGQQAPTFGLRLRNFAVDPAEHNSSSVASNPTSSMSWHMAEEMPMEQPAQVPGPVSRPLILLPMHPVPRPPQQIAVPPQPAAAPSFQVQPSVNTQQLYIMKFANVEYLQTYYIKSSAGAYTEQSHATYQIFTLCSDTNDNLKLFVPSELTARSIPAALLRSSVPRHVTLQVMNQWKCANLSFTHVANHPHVQVTSTTIQPVPAKLIILF